LPLRRRGGGRTTQQGDRPTKAVERLSKIGDNLVALITSKRPRRGEVILDVDDQAVEHRERRSLISVQARQVVGRTTTVRHRPNRRFEFWRVDHQSQSKSHPAQAHRLTTDLPGESRGAADRTPRPPQAYEAIMSSRRDPKFAADPNEAPPSG
jgi:hypothetical protein